MFVCLSVCLSVSLFVCLSYLIKLKIYISITKSYSIVLVQNAYFQSSEHYFECLCLCVMMSICLSVRLSLLLKPDGAYVLGLHAVVWFVDH